MNESEESGREDNQMDDYLGHFQVLQIGSDGEEVTDEICLRFAGTSKGAAVHGAVTGLKQLSTVRDVEDVEVWQDD